MSLTGFLIVNPVAGRGNPDRDLEQIQTILSDHMTLQVEFTSPELNASQLAEKAVKQQADRIIAVGGDGTVSAVARSLIDTSIPLGIIPYGTANALAAALSIPTDLEAACCTLFQGNVQIIDVASCNGQPFILKASVGYGAETIRHTSRSAKNRLGLLAYIWQGIQQLGQIQWFRVEIETETTHLHLASTTAVAIANAAAQSSILAQGPAEILINDGFLDATIIQFANSFGALGVFVELCRSALGRDQARHGNISHLRARHFRLTTDPPLPVVLDGEPATTTPITIECCPSRLRVLVPSSSTLPENDFTVEPDQAE